jgi:hypothetical protein
MAAPAKDINSSTATLNHITINHIKARIDNIMISLLKAIDMLL